MLVHQYRPSFFRFFDFNVGVSTEVVYEIKRVDSDCFAETRPSAQTALDSRAKGESDTARP